MYASALATWLNSAATCRMPPQKVPLALLPAGLCVTSGWSSGAPPVAATPPTCASLQPWLAARWSSSSPPPKCSRTSTCKAGGRAGGWRGGRRQPQAASARPKEGP
jgi:hypothetical protein